MTRRSQLPSESQARHAGNGKDEWISRFARNASGGLERGTAGRRAADFWPNEPEEYGPAGTILAIRTRAVQIAERPSWPNEPKGRRPAGGSGQGGHFGQTNPRDACETQV
jgi:hypothetical protein